MRPRQKHNVVLERATSADVPVCVPSQADLLEFTALWLVC